MQIKSNPPLANIQHTERVINENQSLKTSASTDRDPSQQGFEQQQRSHEDPSSIEEAEAKELFLLFKKHPSIADTTLSVEMIQQEGIWMFLIKDLLGKVVKKISALQAKHMLAGDPSAKTGALLNRIA